MLPWLDPLAQQDLKVQKTVKLGEIKAELLADSNSTIQLMQIKITRKGDLISEDVISMANLSSPGVKTVKNARVIDFKILDLIFSHFFVTVVKIVKLLEKSNEKLTHI